MCLSLPVNFIWILKLNQAWKPLNCHKPSKIYELLMGCGKNAKNPYN